MRIPAAPANWSPQYQKTINSEIEMADRKNRKVGQDVILGRGDGNRPERLVLPNSQQGGIYTDPADPAFMWRDILGTVSTRTGGGSSPSFSVYRGNIYQWSMTTVGTKEIFNEFHGPHDWVMGSESYLHVHWSTISTPTGSAVWLFEVLWAKGYNQDTFEGTDGSGGPIIVSVAQEAVAAFKHQIAEVLFIAPDGLVSPAAVNVSITSGTATLTAAAALFDASMVERTVRVLGAGAAGADLDTTISAYTSSTSVTLAANASTTVTAQDAFRFRVLDAALIEPDGLWFVRTYRDAAHPGDTLDVAPFLHEVDIHYQSTGVGTKQKNGPDFWT